MKRNLILLARAGAAQGIKGEVRVRPFGESDMLDQYGKLETADGRKLKITRMRLQKNIAIVKFEGVNSRNEAEALNGTDLFVERSKLPPPGEGEFYVSDLIGLDVLDEDEVKIGTIKGVPNFGADDMLEIEPDGQGSAYYLPFTTTVVPKIDFKKRQLIVVPPVEVGEREESEIIRSEKAPEKHK